MDVYQGGATQPASRVPAGQGTVTNFQGSGQDSTTWGFPPRCRVVGSSHVYHDIEPVDDQEFDHIVTIHDSFCGWHLIRDEDVKF